MLWPAFIAFFVGVLILLVFVPLIMLYNKPSFLVAPHDRGKPGGLELKRIYRE
ncbi:hypothetical protein JQS43_19665 [Natronosporangium hydrolyticum]|uniref:Uncharacterized protein n=1 Tax=Natronosporangium hydrolyticum TaxID=2811111 RepID=A0A895Y8U7_9ACTN|nr:hypothetical protein [Natronosporangium hydrolyticum]QSB13761.1 hypothetical protein JQS43_19665 [Natronosporangium hydrolyticum]